jgi:hypothetical protein
MRIKGIEPMIRITLIAVAALATIATASPALAQAAAPVRTLVPSATAPGENVTIERKAAPCADKSCSAKPVKRAYAGAAPLGW